jgi:hypothetical protein
MASNYHNLKGALATEQGRKFSSRREVLVWIKTLLKKGLTHHFHQRDEDEAANAAWDEALEYGYLTIDKRFGHIVVTT